MVGRKVQCEVLFFSLPEVGSVKKVGNEKGDVEEYGGVGEFVPLACAVRHRL
jgi:hypothetical protein